MYGLQNFLYVKELQKPKEVDASQRTASRVRERLNVTRCLADKERCGCHCSVADPDRTADDCSGYQKKSKRKMVEEPGTSHMAVACILE